jgi:CDP-diacylglycerol--glycerol-3-phosphate 3-phosphatidyltransferase
MLIPLGRIPAWVVILFMVREISITALRGIASSERIVLPADYWGKKKAATQTSGLIPIMIYYPIFGVDVFKIGTILIYLALIIAVGSGVNYIIQFTRAILKQYQQ